MPRTFEVFKHPLRDFTAVKRGFSWPGFFFTWIWAFVSRLWVVGAVLFVLSLIIGFLSRQLVHENPLILLLSLVLPLVVGFKGNSWRSEALQNRGFNYVGAIAAANAGEAIAKVRQLGGIIPDDLRVHAAPPAFLSIPPGFRGLLAVAWLTWK